MAQFYVAKTLNSEAKSKDYQKWKAVLKPFQKFIEWCAGEKKKVMTCPTVNGKLKNL